MPTPLTFIPGVVSLASQSLAGVVAFCQRVAQLLGQVPLTCNIAVSGSAPGSVTLRGKVVGMTGKDCRGRFLVGVYLATAVGADPGGAQSEAFNSGLVVATLEVTRHWLVVTETDGTFTLTVSAAPGQVRVPHSAVLGVYDPANQVTIP